MRRRFCASLSASRGEASAPAHRPPRSAPMRPPPSPRAPPPPETSPPPRPCPCAPPPRQLWAAAPRGAGEGCVGRVPRRDHRKPHLRVAEQLVHSDGSLEGEALGSGRGGQSVCARD